MYVISLLLPDFHRLLIGAGVFFCHVKTQATTHSLGTLIFTFSVTLSSI